MDQKGIKKLPAQNLPPQKKNSIKNKNITKIIKKNK